MVKLKKFAGVLVVMALLLLIAFATVQKQSSIAYAEGANAPNATNENEVEPRLFTNLSLAINGGDGKVIATVRNDFTLFSSTVVVYVELYSSDTYFESHVDAELVSRNITQDLDMGDTITAEASTGGVQKYWQARMRYKVNNGSWEERNTGTVIYSATGEFLGYA